MIGLCGKVLDMSILGEGQGLWIGEVRPHCLMSKGTRKILIIPRRSHKGHQRSEKKIDHGFVLEGKQSDCLWAESKLARAMMLRSVALSENFEKIELHGQLTTAVMQFVNFDRDPEIDKISGHSVLRKLCFLPFHETITSLASIILLLSHDKMQFQIKQVMTNTHWYIVMHVFRCESLHTKCRWKVHFWRKSSVAWLSAHNNVPCTSYFLILLQKLFSGLRYVAVKDAGSFYNFYVRLENNVCWHFFIRVLS